MHILKYFLLIFSIYVNINECIDVKVDPVSEETPEVTEDYDNIMDALVDIQEKGDNMMAGIWWQKEILEKLESSLEEAEEQMEDAETHNEALDDERKHLEEEVAELESKRQAIMSRMSLEELQLVKTNEELGPLEKTLALRKTELGKLTLDLTNKQRELETYKNELTSSSKSVVSLNTTPLPILALLAISLLINIVVGIGLANNIITADSRREVESFGKNWIQKVLSLSNQRKKEKKPVREEPKTEKKVKRQNKNTVRHQVEQQNNGNDFDYGLWASDFFKSFGSTSSSFTDDWIGSHANPLKAQF